MEIHQSKINLDALNPKQREAVAADPTHQLILAGAGSGKTSVLVHRIAYLLETQHCTPFAILAVTFTNKAARELRGRIEKLCGQELPGLWAGTFHGLCHRLLRIHWQDADLPEGFQILDSEDQHRLIRRLQRSMELDDQQWPPKQTQWFINKQKEEALRAKDVPNDGQLFTQVMLKVYQAYEENCRRSGLVDFTELMLRSLELLQQHPDIREHYHRRFQYLLVDEFQDTNTLQYAWLQCLTGKNSFVTVVGDDDQSIYSWRGAKIENIHRFQKEYLGCQFTRLEQNYRSTKTILSAANALIRNNDNRLGKELWTDGAEGKPITVYAAFNERDEAHFICTHIDHLRHHGASYNDIAILYRSNAQSRVLEEQLLNRRMPYRVYGGLKFFERAEIKDALAYLRLLSNRDDDAALERVINTPTRGIGHTTLDHVRQNARSNGVSLWHSVLSTIDKVELSARAVSALAHFVNLINDMDTQTQALDLDKQTLHVLDTSGLAVHFRKDKTEKGLSRVENIEELVNATAQFAENYTPAPDEENMTPLIAFLSHVSLEAGEGQAEENSDCVSLMTLHAAKGLEFPTVFLVGMEEGLFPHKMSTEQLHGLEEERRLCYVGMTRAEENLYLCYAESRRLHGYEQINRPSRFLKEVPAEFLHHVRPNVTVKRPSGFSASGSSHNKRAPTNNVAPTKKRTKAGDTNLFLGQRVQHVKFGKGTVTSYEGRGPDTRLQIQFDKHGSKWLIASYVGLKPC